MLTNMQVPFARAMVRRQLLVRAVVLCALLLLAGGFLAHAQVAPATSPEAAEDALALTPSQKVQLQKGLNALGFDVGVADGKIGPRTRAGIASWQSSRGRPASGYLDAEEVTVLIAAEDADEASAMQEVTEAMDREDYAKALELVRPLAEQGYPAAQIMLGRFYASGVIVAKDLEETARWVRLAADQGYAEAQHEMGQLYFSGMGVEKDLEEGARWFRLAADQGYAKAQSVIGQLTFGGNGVPEDRAEGVRWLQLAAEQEVLKAQWLLAIILSQGEGVAQDHAESSRWFCRAALQGHAGAQYSLGVNHFTGTGVPEDHREALIWLERAGAQGHSDALELFGQVVLLPNIEWSPSMKPKHCVHE